jgi:hypothetical protein
MTGTNSDLFTHKSSRSYLNHLVHRNWHLVDMFGLIIVKCCYVLWCYLGTNTLQLDQCWLLGIFLNILSCALRKTMTMWFDS